jgi:uncharacterized protein YggT (Ycf19 family)
MILATTRDTIADYVEALVTVYWIILIAYILIGWIEMMGRIPYNRALSAVIGFIKDASEPYLRLFRRVIPPFGGLDLSPILAILALFFVGNLVADLIRG